MSAEPIPPKKIQQRDQRGRVKTLDNPEYIEYQKKQQQAQSQTRLNNPDDAVIKATKNLVLDRTTSGIMQGKVATPYKQLNPHQQSILDQARIRDDYVKGRISESQALDRLGISRQETTKKLAKQTQDFARQAEKKAISETTKQDTARQAAAQYGVAVGTIQSSGLGAFSSDSQVSKNAAVSQFVAAQRNQMSQAATQAQREGRIKVTTPDGKERIFKDRAAAEKFIERTQGSYVSEVQGPTQYTKKFTLKLTEGEQQKRVPAGSLEFIYGKPKGIQVDYKQGDILQNVGAGFYNALRYSDIVDTKEAPKPEGIEWFNYYASKGLRPFYNIPLSLSGDKTIQPTFSSTVIDVPIQLATKGKTETHDPIGDFVRKDPLGTALEIPAEAALWVTGAKAVSVGSKIGSKYSPLLYQSKKIPVSPGENPEIIYRGITFKDKPVIGVQQGKIVKGFDPDKVATSLQKVKVTSLGRDGIEAAVGSGIEKELIYSEKTLNQLVSRGVIPDIAKQRAIQSKIITSQGVKITSEVGAFGKEPIEGLTQKQSDFIFKGIVKEQKAKDVDLVHGSAALRPQLGETIKETAGKSVKLGDVDIHPTGKTGGIKMKKADKMIKAFAEGFPIEPGQELKIIGYGGSQTTNRALELTGGTLKEPKKILEVVLRSEDESKYGIESGSKILGEKIPFKQSVTAKDIPVKLHTADYQLLTNIKQVTAFQKGSQPLYLTVYPALLP